MRLGRWTTLVLLAPLAGCAPDDSATAVPPRGEGSRLVVREQRAAHPVYREGSLGFLRVERVADGAVIIDRRVKTALPGREATIFARRLPPGRYRLVSHQRPCDGNCGVLDPPTARCETVAHITPGTTRRVTFAVTPGAACVVKRLEPPRGTARR